MAAYFVIPAVAAFLALLYGCSIRQWLLPTLLTFGLTLIGGLISRPMPGLGQTIGVIISAFLIFMLFTRPAMKAAETQKKEQEKNTPNEEDI